MKCLKFIEEIRELDVKNSNSICFLLGRRISGTEDTGITPSLS